jgi:hypothetical protein
MTFATVGRLRGHDWIEGRREETEMTDQVEIVRTRGSTVAVTRFHVGAADLPEIGDRMGWAFGAVAAGLANARVEAAGPAIARYEPRGDGIDVAAGFEVSGSFAAPPGLERLDLAPVEAAHTTHVGPYRGLPSAYRRLQEETPDHRVLAPGGPMWEEHWSGPGTPESETRTEVFWPLQEG